MMPATGPCRHVDMIRPVRPSAPGCEECLQLHQGWVHLRMCLTCGHVGCCDQSPGRHATKHFRATGHPLIQSLEAGEGWIYCYLDDVYVEVPARAGMPW